MPASSSAWSAGVVAPARPTSTTRDTRANGTRKITSSFNVTSKR